MAPTDSPARRTLSHCACHRELLVPLEEVPEGLVSDKGEKGGELVTGDSLSSGAGLGSVEVRNGVLVDVALLGSPVEGAFHGGDSGSGGLACGPALDMEGFELGDAEGWMGLCEGLEEVPVPPVGFRASVGLRPLKELV